MTEPALDQVPASSWARRLPLAHVWRGGGWGGRVLLVAITLYAVWHLAIVVVPVAQRSAMKHQHLASGSYAWWAAQHARPAMYNFGNEYFLSPLPLTAKNVETPTSPAREQAHHLWLNHYPLQVPLWWYRLEMGKRGRRFYILERSRFQGEQVITRFALQADGAGALRFVEVDW